MMDELPYFFKLLAANHLIRDVLTLNRISEYELAGQTYIRTAPGKVSLQDFQLDEQEKFRGVDIWITPFGTLIDFLTDDLKYFNNALLYFNSRRSAKRKRPLFKDNEEFLVRGRKTAKFNMLSQNVHGTIFQSDGFGCMISLSFFPDTRIGGNQKKFKLRPDMERLV